MFPHTFPILYPYFTHTLLILYTYVCNAPLLSLPYIVPPSRNGIIVRKTAVLWWDRKPFVGGFNYCNNQLPLKIFERNFVMQKITSLGFNNNCKIFLVCHFTRCHQPPGMCELKIQYVNNLHSPTYCMY